MLCKADLLLTKIKGEKNDYTNEDIPIPGTDQQSATFDHHRATSNECEPSPAGGAGTVWFREQGTILRHGE